MEHSVEQKEKLTFSEHLRIIFRQPLEIIGNFFYKLGVKPNVITFTGVIGTLIGAIFVAYGKLTLGGVIIMVMSAVDVLDGAVARAGGEPEEFGAFVDSVSDRYSDLMIFGSLLWYFVETESYLDGVVTFLAAAGSVLVSYVRARAQSLGFEAKVGIMTRAERIIVVVAALIFNKPFIGVLLIAVFGNITAIQRIMHVRKQAYLRKSNRNEND
ncbi:MAG: CDP-alcohol phosphatidyltransferase family protein [Anaerolineales bacterium]